MIFINARVIFPDAIREDLAVTVGARKIVEIGAPVAGANDVVDLHGNFLAPGFIDPHTHYDAQIAWDPLLTCSPWHGVTTVVMGNCGVGFAPFATTTPAGERPRCY